MTGNRTEPCLFVIFGATGDLNRRKLLPALYELSRRNLLANFQILGVARSNEMTDAAFRSLAGDVISSIQQESGGTGTWCDQCLHYRSVGEGEEEDYRRLAREIATLEQQYNLPGNRVYYLALPPQSFVATIEGIGRSGLNESRGWTRIVIEKPFGRDVASSKDLNARLHAFFKESQIYRIDHYLGKETVQNLLVFRFANPVFESVWNRDRIENVQITVAEELGVEKRAGYYERSGALRDMVQNHLTQVLTLIGMEPPAMMDAESIRDEKEKVLRSIRPIAPEDVVFGQYAEGQIEGQPVSAYRQEPGVDKDSRTETFVALRMQIANWRWQGVPFYLRTGKRMPKRVSKVVVTFKVAPVSMFRPLGGACYPESNVLVMTLQPDEGFNLQFQVKAPGQPVALATENLHFRYTEAFSRLADAYETLLLDILTGDRTLFVRADWVETSWALYDSILDSHLAVREYPAGAWGPPEAQALPAADGHQWFPL
jgi:glucose-6-phosphate 1-dehydrogenase